MSSDNIENYSLAVTGSDRGILEISIGGRLNFDTIDKLWDKTTELIEELEPNKIIIDTKDIEYCDTLGVTYFIKLNKYSTDYGYEYEIINF
ncbi:MAG: STAS domain-containing protein, partial [Candidatus Dadabacteria bacterium]|nr:STAS domain-containing protein [Candidatus Dadabacteria bacterium]NIQ17005.1 STAS domain-containing protein [Candidatus Dadabacteria bacterium]